MIQVVLFSGTHTERERERDLKAKQIQVQSDLCWSDLLFLCIYHSFTPSLLCLSPSLHTQNATGVVTGFVEHQRRCSV